MIVGQQDNFFKFRRRYCGTHVATYRLIKIFFVGLMWKHEGPHAGLIEIFFATSVSTCMPHRLYGDDLIENKREGHQCY